MKTIQLKTAVKEIHNGIEVDIDTKELIRLTVRNTPAGGFTVEDMMKRMRILNLLEMANGGLELEDADFDNLSKYVKEMKWNIVSQAIIDFSKQF